MADKNITLRQKNTSGVYDKLYTKTTATQSKLSATTAALFGNDITNSDAALAELATSIKGLFGNVILVKDSHGSFIEGAVVQGLVGENVTNANGVAYGVVSGSSVTVIPPYIDMKSKTVNVTSSDLKITEVVLDSYLENDIIRYTTSTSVKFSKYVKSVDVCCVAGGGAGGQGRYDNASGGGGGGGGGIVNSLSKSVTSETVYNIVVGAGGVYKGSGTKANDGGNTSFLGVSATGGKGATFKQYDGHNWRAYGGSAGVTGCGDGGGSSAAGTSNTTVSEFNDGVTFYSGGGGGGGTTTVMSGGTPNGATGGAVQNSGSKKINAGVSNVGGGGGGGGYYIDPNFSVITSNGSSGGPGLVAIRFHF